MSTAFATAGYARLFEPRVEQEDGGSEWVSNQPWTLEVLINGFEGNHDVLKLLNKLTVTELAESGNCSKGYVSQVKHGIRSPSAKLIQAIASSGHYTKTRGAQSRQALDLFLQSSHLP